MQMTRSVDSKQVLAVGLLMALFAAEVVAGNGGNYVSNLLTFLTSSLEGTLGKVIGVAGILYGLVAGIKNGSLAGFGIGVGLAIGSYYGPKMITTMSTAVLF